jgi:hypothetical protein
MLVEAIRSSETLVIKRATRHSILEDDILHRTIRPTITLAIWWTGELAGVFAIVCL